MFLLGVLTQLALFLFDTPNQNFAILMGFCWIILPILESLFPRRSDIFLTAFFVVSTFGFYYLIYLNNILPLPYALMGSLAALAVLPKFVSFLVAAIFALSPLAILVWHPSLADGLWSRLLLINLLVPMFFYVLVFNLSQSQQSLRLALENANKANSIKTNFLSNMSHEIRTPLNGLFGSLQVIQLNASNADKVRKFAATGLESFEYIENLVQNILDINKLAEGKLKLFPQLTLWVGVIERAVNELRPNAELKGLSLDLHVDDELRCQTRYVDDMRLNQIVSHLIYNAIKFTKQGGISCTLKTVNIPDQVEIIVKDTGVGIPKGNMDHIFELFEQVEPSRYSENRGSGLGLPILKNLAKMMGGEVHVQSKEGEGSTFTVRLNLPLHSST